MPEELKRGIDYERIFPRPFPQPDPVPWWKVIDSLEGDNLRRVINKQIEVQITVMEKEIELLREFHDVVGKIKF